MCIKHVVKNKDDVFETIVQQHKSFICTAKQQRRNKNVILKICGRIHDFFDTLRNEECLFIFLLLAMLVSFTVVLAVYMLYIYT